MIPQHSIEKLIEYNAQVFDSFSAFTQCQDNTHLFLKGNRPVEKTVIKAANDLNQARLMGNNAYRYMESKIIDCLSGFLMPGYLTPENGYYSLLVRDKIHDAKDIILSQYQDMPSLHQYVYGRYRHQVGVWLSESFLYGFQKEVWYQPDGVQIETVQICKISYRLERTM